MRVGATFAYCFCTVRHDACAMLCFKERRRTTSISVDNVCHFKCIRRRCFVQCFRRTLIHIRESTVAGARNAYERVLLCWRYIDGVGAHVLSPPTHRFIERTTVAPPSPRYYFRVTAPVDARLAVLTPPTKYSSGAVVTVGPQKSVSVVYIGVRSAAPAYYTYVVHITAQQGSAQHA